MVVSMWSAKCDETWKRSEIWRHFHKIKSRRPLPKAINSCQEIGWHILSLPWSYRSLLLDLAWVLKDTMSANSQEELVIATGILSKLKMAWYSDVLVYHNAFDILLREKIIDYKSMCKRENKGLSGCKISAFSWWSKGSSKGHGS